VQGERRRINNIDNRTYLDTVEVIGSIPVAPIGSNVFRLISFPSLLLIHPIGCNRQKLPNSAQFVFETAQFLSKTVRCDPLVLIHADCVDELHLHFGMAHHFGNVLRGNSVFV
jgi:hypothetical protein